MGPLYHSSDRPVRGHVINMFSKIVKPNGEQPDELEKSIGEALLELEVNSDLKNQLRELYITSARELEKKFSGKHVLIVGQRRILPKPTRKTRNQKQMRPRSRTLTAVHDSILEDLAFPSEIVGKRIRVKLDASRLTKVTLEKAQQTNVEHKLDTFAAVYKKLTGKDTTFGFEL